MWGECKNCGAVGEHEEVQIMDEQTLVQCSQCKKFFVTDTNKKDRVPLKITLSGDRACGKTVMAYFLKGILEQLGARVTMQASDKPWKAWRDATVYAAIPKRFDRMSISIIEEVANTPQSLHASERNLRIFRGEDNEKHNC